LSHIDAREVSNWLVSSSVLIPHNGGRVTFVHQSVTEYLAAAELARRYQSSPYILKAKLSLTRWDQALFMTLSLLPPAQADVFLQDVIQADFALALSAAKYLEVGRDEVVSKLLSEIPDRIQASEPFEWNILSAVEFSLPLTDAHEPHIRTLIGCGGTIGAAAVLRLVALKGEEVKEELLQLLVDCCDDYNFCRNGIARALKPFATDGDAKRVARWADSVQGTVSPDSDDDDTEGFTSGAAAFLAGLDLSIIRREFLPPDESVEIPEIRARILCDILQDHHSTAALNFAGELLLRGVKEAAMAIYIISEFAKPDCELSWASFTAAHVGVLISILDDADESWALDALKCFCAARPDLAEAVKQEAAKKSGIEKAALVYCVSPADFTPVFQAFGELVEMSDEQRREQPFRILREIECDWTGKEKLFVQLLRLRDMQLASVLLAAAVPPSIPSLGNLEIGSIDWWLEWTMEVGSSGVDYWFILQLGGLFAEHLNHEVQHEFVAEFSKSSSKFRRLLLRFVLPFLSDITTEVFSEDAVSFLLADLSTEGSVSSIHGHLLGNTATEEFVTERLLPLLQDAKQPLLKNLHEVLGQAGSRHGRRYVLE
jgi:hypothetical protein